MDTPRGRRRVMFWGATVEQGIEKFIQRVGEKPVPSSLRA
jgi:hypothetical protein